MTGEVLSIGDELTSGQRLDTNTQWLSRRLGDLGVWVVRHGTVADDLPVLTSAVAESLARADVLVLTGGLGPTADDLTREAIAAAAQVPLRRDSGVVEQIRTMFASRGRTMPARNARQADLPEGAAAIPNPTGTAPGVAMCVPNGAGTACRVFALPGVPAEMHGMWERSVAPAVAAAMPTRRVIRRRCVRCFGAGESHIEAMLPDLIARGREPLVGITASDATITLRVTASASTAEQADKAMQPTIDTIRRTLGELVYGEGEDQLQDAVADLLDGFGLNGGPARLVTAESWTGGLLGHWMAGPPHARVWSRTGPAATGTASLKELEGQAACLLAEAPGGADFALVAGAPGHSEPPRVGAAVAWPGGASSESWTVVGDPTVAKARIAKHALDLLRRTLMGLRQGAENA